MILNHFLSRFYKISNIVFLSSVYSKILNASESSLAKSKLFFSLISFLFPYFLLMTKGRVEIEVFKHLKYDSYSLS